MKYLIFKVTAFKITAQFTFKMRKYKWFFLKVFTIMIYIFHSSFLKADAGIEWVVTYNNNSVNLGEVPVAIALDDSGNTFVTGYSTGSSANNDFATVKYNSNGIQKWVNRFIGTGDFDDKPTSIVTDNSGNVYVTGGAYMSNTGYDFITIKYNTSGQQQWIKYFNGFVGGGSDLPKTIKVDNLGNVIVTGMTQTAISAYDIFTIKYDQDGNVIWTKQYNGSGNLDDKPYSMFIDKQNNVYVTGSIRNNMNNDDIITIKYNLNGVQEWAKTYNGTGNDDDRGIGVASDIHNNIYVGGYAHNGSSTGYDFVLIKYNSAGDQQFLKTLNYSGSSQDIADVMTMDSFSNIYITGNISFYNCFTCKYDTAGNLQWSRVASTCTPTAIEADNSGNVYIAGKTSQTLSDYMLIKYDVSGALKWSEFYDGPEHSKDYGTSMVIDQNRNIYLTGSSLNNGTSWDYATIKYSEPLGIQLLSTGFPETYKLFQNYPNPFNPNTVICYTIKISLDSKVNLTVYNSSGKDIETLVNEQQSKGSYNVKFEGSHLASGIYFYKLSVGEFSEVKKMVLLK